MNDTEAWERNALDQLASGPKALHYPGFMGGVCERLVAKGHATRAPTERAEQFLYTITLAGLAQLPPPPLPHVSGGFRCVLADPPWSFRTFDKRELAPTQGEQPYPTMSLDDIKALPVADVCADDCVLVLWTVSHLQDEAADVARAWGFTPKSLGPVWVKDGMGMGYWYRQEVEITRLCTRGRPKRLSKGVRQVIHAPRRAHSQKPEEIYRRVEDLVEGPYLELFARPTRRRRGWSYWGNQLNLFSGHSRV